MYFKILATDYSKDQNKHKERIPKSNNINFQEKDIVYWKKKIKKTEAISGTHIYITPHFLSGGQITNSEGNQANYLYHQRRKKHAERQIKQLKNCSKTVLILDFETLKKCENFYQQRHTKTKHVQWNYLPITS